MQTLTASRHPLMDLELLAYPGQDPNKRLYRFGYETYFNKMPIIEMGEKLLDEKVKLSTDILQNLGKVLSHATWIKNADPGEGNFHRIILGMQPPFKGIDDLWIPGSEFVVGAWGKGFETPIHGHAPGFIHEELISGSMLVNTYRRISDRKARPIKSVVTLPGTNVSAYVTPTFDNLLDRSSIIHNFKVLEFSTSLHYFPEHTRDGRDNKFEVEYFDDVYDLEGHAHQITPFEGMYLRKGDVVLVRSQNVSEYGDHYIVVTGHNVVKEEGLRPQTTAIAAPGNKLLNKYEMKTGVTLLKLDEESRREFFAFHDIQTATGEVVFPMAY